MIERPPEGHPKGQLWGDKPRDAGIYLTVNLVFIVL